jgi:intracellular septation protein A
MTLVDYRDRASVLVWVALMGLVAQRVLALPSREITATVLGSPITLTITTNTILGVLLAALVASGTESVVRAHPRVRAGAMRTAGQLNLILMESNHWVFWALPVALVVVALFLLPVTPSQSYWLLGLMLTAAALGVSMAGIYYTIDPFARGYRRARLGMNALTYAVALVLFLVVYRSRARSIVSATEVMLVSGLLALELLRGSGRPMLMITLYAGITALVLGQVTWALNYWRLASLTGGLVLLVVFYDVVGLAQNALQGRIGRRVIIEYGLITVAAMALIWKFAP